MGAESIVRAAATISLVFLVILCINSAGFLRKLERIRADAEHIQDQLVWNSETLRADSCSYTSGPTSWAMLKNRCKNFKSLGFRYIECLTKEFSISDRLVDCLSQSSCNKLYDKFIAVNFVVLGIAGSLAIMSIFTVFCAGSKNYRGWSIAWTASSLLANLGFWVTFFLFYAYRKNATCVQVMFRHNWNIGVVLLGVTTAITFGFVMVVTCTLAGNKKLDADSLHKTFQDEEQLLAGAGIGRREPTPTPRSGRKNNPYQ